MKARFAAQLLALTLILCAPLACNAAIVELTWSGVTAFGGNDGLGLFGPAGAMPADVSYQAKFRYDTTVQFVENGTNGSEEVKGGLFYGSPSPLVSASVTINGQTLGMGGEYAGEYFRQSGQGASNVSTLAQRAIHTAGLALSLVAVGGARIRRRRMPPPAYTAAAVRSVRS
jgi:hypothetical protein